MTTRTYKVSARHPAPQFNITDQVFTCHRNHDGTWYATHDHMGCGKDRPDSVSAISYLLDNEAYHSHGRSIIAQP